jgi:hypothetical protein
LFFSFILFHFHLFATNVTQALSLEAIKEEAGTTSRDNRNNTYTIDNVHILLAKTSTHTNHSSKEIWDPLPLSKAYNPYYEHFGARQHEK